MRIGGLGIATLLFIAVMAAYFAYLSGIFQTDRYRQGYRLTITIRDNGQLKSGSSVLRYVATDVRGGIAKGGVSRLDGEATYIDLGGGRNVVALLDDPDFPLRALDRSGLEAVRWFTGLKQGRFDLPPDKLPQLATFKDITNPRSIVLFKPADIADALGPGTEVAGGTIEITREAPSYRLTSVFPWLAAMIEREHRPGGIIDNPHVFSLNSSHIVRK